MSSTWEPRSVSTSTGQTQGGVSGADADHADDNDTTLSFATDHVPSNGGDVTETPDSYHARELVSPIYVLVYESCIPPHGGVGRELAVADTAI